MKESIDELKNEFKTKVLFWNNIQNIKIKIALLILFIALIGLKVFTTVLTFDWLVSLFS